MIFVAAFYLFLLGMVMDGVSLKNKLSADLERESSELYTLQNAAEQKNKDLTLGHFLKLGYAESRRFEVIKTVRNVATIETPLY